MKIAKALVMAGAPSRHGWDDLSEGPSLLFPVANRPIIFHVLERLRDARLLEATILAPSAWHGALRAAVGDGADWNLQVSYGESVPGAGLGEALSSCERFIGDEPVLVHQADALLRGRLAVHLDAFADDRLDALALRATSAAPVSDLRPLPPTPGYMLSPQATEVLRAAATPDNPISEVRARGGRVRIASVDACLPCHGDLADLLDGNRRMLAELAAELDEPVLPGNAIQGPVQIHPTADVRDCVLRGPAVIGAGAVLRDAYIGPYTSIGANVTIEGAEIEHSIVLHGAELRHVGQRVESSVIGAGARVVRTFQRPASLRLALGTGSAITLA